MSTLIVEKMKTGNNIFLKKNIKDIALILLAGYFIYTSVVFLVGYYYSYNMSIENQLEFALKCVFEFIKASLVFFPSFFSLEASNISLLFLKPYIVAFYVYIAFGALYRLSPPFKRKESVSPFLVSFGLVFILYTPPMTNLDILLSIISMLNNLNWYQIVEAISILGWINILGFIVQIFVLIKADKDFIRVITVIVIVGNIFALIPVVSESIKLISPQLYNSQIY